MYIFRADGNARIGAGHIMRMLTIADALAKQLGENEDITFICADEESSAFARSRGYKAITLGTDYQNMESELGIIDNYLSNDEAFDDARGKGILVDSYNVTDPYLASLRKYGRVFYMDDMQEHSYPVDGIINYNAYADKNKYKELYPSEVIKLIGPKYMPLRPQFVGREYKVSDKVRNVLITTGGGDLDNIAGHILLAINNTTDIRFHLVSGQFNPHLEDLENLADEMGNVTIYKSVDDMAGLMCSCDFAITAGGGTMNELCALGVPFMCFTYAENQEPGAEYMAANNIADYAGPYYRDKDSVIKSIADLFTTNIYSTDIKAIHSRNGKGMIDGKGADRIAETLRNY